MKTIFKQHLIFFSIAICLLFQIHNVKAQNAITPSMPVVCPGVVVDYSWFAAVGGCTYTWTVTNGKFQAVAGGTLNGAQTQITGNNLTNVKIVWDNVASSFTSPLWTAGFGSISVSTSGCVGGGSSSQNNILIKTLNGIVPDAISNATSASVSMCATSPITYSTTKVRFANTGGSVYTSSIYG